MPPKGYNHFDSIEGLLDALSKTFRGRTAIDRVRDGYVFRGHANSDWPLEPSILRSTGDPQVVRAREQYTEAFVADLRAARTALNIPGEDEVSLHAVARHFGFPTTLLDFTYNFEVAAAFACNDDHLGEYGVVYQFSVRAIEDLVNPFRVVGRSRAETDQILSRIGLTLIPPIEIVSLPTVNRVSAQEGLFFSLHPRQVAAMARDCIDRYYFRQSDKNDHKLQDVYAALFPSDGLLDDFVRDWRIQNPCVPASLA